MKRIFSLAICIAFCVSMLCSCKNNDTAYMTLSNENATAATKNLYEYICEMYGTKIISGQQESTWVDTSEYEMNYIYDTTGKLPAMRGFDFMDDDFDGVVERAIQWWNKGGIVTICWHCGSDFSGSYEDSKNDEVDNWDELLTDKSEENIDFIKNMDKAGMALKRLQDEGIPVLWRPFHEFDGKWFWWGKGGASNFKKLWRTMYNHFTNDLQLNNLIWVLGYSHNGYKYAGAPDLWYPGDEYCDIVGADSYEVAENGAEERLHKIVRRITNDSKPLIFHECGLIPTQQQLQETPWCSFMAWHTQWLVDTNSKEHLKEIYNSDYVITLDELPRFSE